MEKYPHTIRFLLLASALLTLLSGMWAGLLRMDFEIPMLQAGLALAHGPLMVCGFLGTLIGLERAVALNRRWAYISPLLTAVGTWLLIVGIYSRIGALLVSLGSAALVGNYAVIIYRQYAAHTLTMALGAVLWLVGNLFWYFGAEIPTMVHWWAGFLVLTIAGERLELSRMAAPRSQIGYFVLSGALYLTGLVAATLWKVRGLPIAGAGMLLLTLWLVHNDIAWRTVRLRGLPRFIAVHLLAGYFWLAAGAVWWIRSDRLFADASWQAFHYDAMLHSVFLGFAFSMIFAHAPIIFPAITGRPLVYRPAFYAHGALLHVSLLIRVVSDLWASFPSYRWSGILTIVAVLMFFANNVYALVTGRPSTAAS